MILTPEQRHREGVLARTRTPRCGLRHRGPCSGRLQCDHIIERQRLRIWLSRCRLSGEPLICLACSGRGWLPRLTATTEAACCANFRGGECCGIPIPIDVETFTEETCAACLGTGEASLEELVADDRNGWLLCEGHHGLKTAHLIQIFRHELPPAVEAFATDYRIEWALARDFVGAR